MEQWYVKGTTLFAVVWIGSIYPTANKHPVVERRKTKWVGRVQETVIAVLAGGELGSLEVFFIIETYLYVQDNSSVPLLEAWNVRMLHKPELILVGYQNQSTFAAYCSILTF